MKNRFRIIFILIFFVSGFSGLIYESIWTHYLKLFLGHAAYAQVLVLIIFMGGMAIGAYLASRFSSRWKRLFRGYAIVELIIGIFALFFHESFVSFLDFSYNTVFAGLDSPVSISLYKWGASALLILPQSILLGTTFPLMSAAILRAFPATPGKNISLIYFANSLGAAIGVLFSGFLLIKSFGLPGTIRIAGIINIVLASLVIILANKKEVLNPLPEKTGPEQTSKTSFQHKSLLLVAAFTGMASFIYEIGWIRMLNLVLGTSTHAFELMLSSFILGLALGGFWIRKRIDKMPDPILSLGYIQVVMGIMALSTLLLYGNSFNFMEWIMETTSKDDTGYFMFNLSSNGIAFLIMFPATFCAGMTLPIITTILLKTRGERSIGSVYTWNTIGSILGVIIAVYFGMPFLGLKGLISLGAGIDIALGIILIFVIFSKENKSPKKIIIATGGVVFLFYIAFFFTFDSHKMASGVFRTSQILTSDNTEILFYKDGKTATISTILFKNEDIISLRTNGKPDASVYQFKKEFGTDDDATMIQLGIIPMCLNTNATDVAIIGLGAGITTKSILTNPIIQSVKTIEIEKEILEACKILKPYINEIFEDERSKIIIDDAKSYFSVCNKKFDIIISEPSNPWVSGVAGLFSTEFYSLIQNSLKVDGIFAQWLQLYEIDLTQVVSILKSLSENFSDYHIYMLDDNNCLFIGKKDGIINPLNDRIFSIPKISELLHTIHVNNIQDIRLRYLGNKEILDPFINSYMIKKSSDYYPTLERESTKMRFLNKSATDLYSFTNYLHPVISLLDNLDHEPAATKMTYNQFYSMSKQAMEAISLRDFFLNNDFNLNYLNLPQEYRQEAIMLKSLFNDSLYQNYNRLPLLFNNATRMTPYLSPKEMVKIWESIGLYSNTQISIEEKHWIGLFTSVAKREPETMISEGEYILKHSTNIPIYPKEYLVSSIMIGYLMLDKNPNALNTYNLYKNQLSDDYRAIMLFKFLEAVCIY